ncbi:hypothetical protein AMATHDRAFT_140413 [Amanita thiersii Skay4041]|uniref:Aminodeoxychorismate lyase n=1 Tax=Amanita thiersii Skay4041 TaxID=703135 RepID=A0A2A9NWS7_9AGAR|nr:hypothetical protein AMATHDRAFT_140413 [Amanita thiersii Skay4041]
MSHSLDYQLSTAIRFDRELLSAQWNDDAGGPSPFLLLSYHFDRLISAAEYHGWPQVKAVLSHDTLKDLCTKKIEEHEAANAALIRVLLTETCTLTATLGTTTPLPPEFLAVLHSKPQATIPIFGPLWSIRVDSEPTTTSIFTKTKTTRRDAYDLARERANLAPLGVTTQLADVLLFNTDQKVTETSIFNVALFREGRWLTPPASTGCLLGVFRRWLLENSYIHEAPHGILSKDTIIQGEHIMLFNAVQGCRFGRIE